MDGKIALEEHWAIDETLHIAGQPIAASAWRQELDLLLVDFSDKRLAGMDANGIELAVLARTSTSPPAASSTTRRSAAR